MKRFALIQRLGCGIGLFDSTVRHGGGMETRGLAPRQGASLLLGVILGLQLCVRSPDSHAQARNEPRVENAEGLKGATAAMNTMEFKRALETLKPLADKGDSNAQFNLGAMYASGRGVRSDPTEAVRLYRLAAAKNHLGAMNNLAYMLKTGSGTAKDEREALKWYEQIAASPREDPGAMALKNLASKNIESIRGCLALPNGCEVLPANERGARRTRD
ncbi:MAG: sel1 repeat family protein [Betaproteobacteria bacterium]|nr:sel1 repeat family protein [Betaproteobacteria bacterium]